MDKEQKKRAYFLSEIENLFSLCDKQGCPRFSPFLTEEQQAEIDSFVRRLAGKEFQLLFYGGYRDARRKMLGVFPGYITPDPGDFPLLGFTARFSEHYAVEHRDVLGTLMAQQIRRETIGDIVVQRGKAIIFAEERVRRVVATQIDRIGGVGVVIEEGFEPFEVEEKFLALKGTLASLRLDAAVALCAGLSREKASSLISAGLVSVNHLEKKDQSALLTEGAVLVIRGKGKFRLEKVGGPTKKGRISVTFLKYL